MRTILCLCFASLLCVSTARAQYPGYGGTYPGGYPGGSNGYNGYPGLYGGGLSPYLNMIGRGVSPSAAYYNFVRPYTGGTFGNAFGPQGGYGRMPFFPNQIPVYADEDTDIQKQLKGRVDEKGQLKVDMPPAGHPSGFMNTEGYFGSPNGIQGFGAARKPQQIGTPPHH
jgi:hypothetical protein